MTDPALEALLAAHVGLLEGAVAVPGPTGTVCHLEGLVFAAFAGGVAEFRLGEAVSAAALRTPDAKASARGAGWVRFAPRRLDALARDRAIAWFESAWRHADAELAGAADEPDEDEDGPDDDAGERGAGVPPDRRGPAPISRESDRPAR